MKIIMEVDPPASQNMSSPLSGNIQTSGYNSRDLESAVSNGNNAIPAPGALKRCSSAPMINILVSTASMQIR